MTPYDSLMWEQDGHVATVTLNRPDKRNAMSWAMFEEIESAFERASRDSEVRCLVVAGAGGAFSSGADLADPANLQGSAFDLRDRMRRIDQIARAVIDCSKPTIAKVTGVAAGAGCNLALCCDFIVASTNASFAELFVKRGLVVDFGGSWALTRLLPLHKAKELAFLGDTLSAAEADRFGLLNRLCDEEEIDEVVEELAERLCSMPPRTLAMIKHNLNRAPERSLEATLEAESAAQSLCATSEDTREAIASWLEKRPPRFTGR
jgi:2-(1,2-epoxy-1,2-dihydrophenyl)acetyl-CoA isomerase